MKQTIYHITTNQQWLQAQQAGTYTHPSLEAEGFIHTSLPEQVYKTAERYYHGQSGLILLEIDCSKLKAELKYEPASSGEKFYHIYGPLNLDAVRKTHQIQEKPSGFDIPTL